MDDIEKLKQENKKLQDSITAKSDLISVTAHQLRTSLTALKWILQMFADKDFGELSVEQTDYVQKALTSNERMITLVTNLLSANHTDGAIATSSIQEIDINKLINEVVFEFYGEAHKKNVALTFSDSSSTAPLIKCDMNMIRMVLEVIIENAIKYSNSNGEVSLILETKTSTKTIVINIHDNGIGIGEADQAHIFDKFFRAENAKKVGSGSGLGLFIARNILAQHGGDITVESSEGAGTTFSITLPIS